MINQSTLDSLKAMRLTAMAAELERQLEDAATYRTLGFEERIGLLVDAEWNRRQANKLSRYIKNAHFAAPNATIEGIEYHEDRKLDKAGDPSVRHMPIYNGQASYHPERCIRKWKNLSCLCPWTCGLPEVQICKVYPHAGTFG